MSYDVGNNPVSTMFSYEILNDGKYHTVQLLSIMKVMKQRFSSRVERSYWSRSAKYCALIGREFRRLSYAIKNQLKASITPY